MTELVTVTERGRELAFSFEDINRYHGGGSPAGVATAFTVLQRAFALLSPQAPPARRSVIIRTAFRGPGARDGFEAVTRAVSDDRFTVDRTLVRPDLGRLREDFVFCIGIGGSTVTLALRDGFVTDEFIDLARTQNRTAPQEARLDDLKGTLAQQLLATPAEQIYDTLAG
ncbi:hypothetical protein ORI20_18140 [Mycobacterium sp. CVI_P3]|uniref:Uncharacterized protein n=1 Tax=Mycobacterium pinniadriaticum TaxID=2994102 RepID=A0ABT3SGT5_9MYCO|nr:hypothetical protein [Mycobacterium pinniadriaticum]MCX2932197.1 hypothetical protein [Mycobacterium pinniadriaticum]MCX2938703.1 hypothetical protein [Mycobacterium pinniadriaticum]